MLWRKKKKTINEAVQRKTSFLSPYVQ